MDFILLDEVFARAGGHASIAFYCSNCKSKDLKVFINPLHSKHIFRVFKFWLSGSLESSSVLHPQNYSTRMKITDKTSFPKITKEDPQQEIIALKEVFGQ